ncbi:MAG: RNA polymerase factor sigma-54, partial [Leptospiraceae bacterium]|nr:RNA polymerase factor sigma-54 [Leptospiraceae bacterium]
DVYKRQEFELGEILISMIDKNGFISQTTEELAKELNVDFKIVKKVRQCIHELDPIGIGAIDLTHSLFIQAKLLYPKDYKLHKIIKEYLKDLEKLDYKKIAKQMDLAEKEIIQISKKIASLQPFPASGFVSEKPEYIIPDAIVLETEGEFVVVLNDEWLPKVSISKEYKNFLIQSKSIEEKNYFDSKINSAKWLIRSINQRKYTLLKVLNCIVEFQIDFFRFGVNHIKPLTLRDIAEKLDIHESTISRVTSNKYIQTNWGIVELKWFFSSGVRTHDGEKESSKKIQELLKNLIKNESPESPYSDQEIVELMQKQGIEIARRTIAKYRKILKILPASSRKKAFNNRKE